jgi:hypothetical protein
MDYSAPSVRDYGTIRDMTWMLAVVGPIEDSAIKAIPFHHTPPSSSPVLP